MPAERPPSHHELRALRRDLSAVTDAQLLQVVGLVDSLAERGAMDELIAPFRGRFGAIHPPRPLRFVRLLFLPLDPVIIPAARYRVGTPAVPRTALAPLAAVVRAALGPRIDPVNALIDGRTVCDAEIVERAGGLLWQAAAAVLAQAPMPADWTAAGLPASLHAPLTGAIVAVLEQADAHQTAAMEAAAGLPVDPGMIERALDRAASAGPAGWSLVLSVLLGRLPAPDVVLRQADGWTTRHGSAALRAAMDQVLDAQLESLEARDAMTEDMLTADLATASAEVHRIAALLDGLGGEPSPAALRARVAAIRRRLDASCRARFANDLTEEFVAPLQAMIRRPDPAAPLRLEVAARHLRTLETEARRLGGASTYDALLHRTAEAVRGIAPETGLGRADKLRLVEILAGPDAALALLE